MKTAIFVDGAFYQRRAWQCLGSQVPEDRARELEFYCKKHLDFKGDTSELYRVYYYDCPPISAILYHPLLKREIDLSEKGNYEWNMKFLNEIRRKRKFALRLGKLNDKQAHYTLRKEVLEELCNGTKDFGQLEERDFRLDVKQKGVDMQIGIDIASIAYKRLCDRMILIAGDSDFVPAAKLARAEGIDFILDPLGSRVKSELYENIDGLRVCDDRFRNFYFEDRKPKPWQNETETESSDPELDELQQQVDKDYKELDPVYRQLLDSLTI